MKYIEKNLTKKSLNFTTKIATTIIHQKLSIFTKIFIIMMHQNYAPNFTQKSQK